MSGLTGAFSGLGEGMTREADRNIKKWNAEELREEEEKLTIAREIRVDEAVRDRQKEQNAYTDKNNRLLRTQKVADLELENSRKVEKSRLDRAGLIDVANINANARVKAAGAKADKGDIVWVPFETADEWGNKTVARRAWSPSKQRFLSDEETRRGPTGHKAQRLADMTAALEEANNLANPANVNTNSLLDAVDKDTAKVSTQEPVSNTPTSNIRYTKDDFANLPAAEKEEWLGPYDRYEDKIAALNRNSVGEAWDSVVEGYKKLSWGRGLK